MMKLGITLLIATVVAISPSLVKAQQTGEEQEANTQTVSAPKTSALSNESILSLSYQNGGLGFGILYKREVRRNRFFRIGLANVGFLTYSETPLYNTNYFSEYSEFTAGLVTGFEFRFQLHRIVWTYTGVDFLLGIDYADVRRKYESPFIDDDFFESYVLRTGLVFNSGVQVKVHEVIMIGVNISPDIYYARRFQKDDSLDDPVTDNAVATSFSSASVQATIIFHWPRKSR